jgi:hypothetical protein
MGTECLCVQLLISLTQLQLNGVIPKLISPEVLLVSTRLTSHTQGFLFFGSHPQIGL